MKEENKMKKKVNVFAYVTIKEEMEIEIESDNAEDLTYEDWITTKAAFAKALTDKYGWADFDDIDLEDFHILD